MTKTKIYSRFDLPPQINVPLSSGSNVDKEAYIYCDINYIVKRYRDTEGASGMPVRLNYNKPIFGDFTKSYTLSDVYSLKENMSNLFDELSPEARSQFKSFNDFMKFVGSADESSINKLFSSDEMAVASQNSLEEPKVVDGDLSPSKTRGSVSIESDGNNKVYN